MSNRCGSSEYTRQVPVSCDMTTLATKVRCGFGDLFTLFVWCLLFPFLSAQWSMGTCCSAYHACLESSEQLYCPRVKCDSSSPHHQPYPSDPRLRQDSCTLRLHHRVAVYIDGKFAQPRKSGPSMLSSQDTFEANGIENEGNFPQVAWPYRFQVNSYFSFTS